jgi:prepilin peptidase CpaA
MDLMRSLRKICALVDFPNQQTAAGGKTKMALHSSFPQWVGWLFGLVGAVAAITDLKNGKIYNWLTLPALVIGIALSVYCFGVMGLWSSLAGVGLAALLFIPLFAFGVLGGGDVKLMMAMGSIFGARGLLDLIVFTFLVAGAGSFALLIRHHRVQAFAKEVYGFLRSLILPGLEIQWPRLRHDIKAPFGIAVFIGVLCVLVGGTL